MQIRLVCDNPDKMSNLHAVAKRWGFEYSEDADFALILTNADERLKLKLLTEPKLGAIYVDFVSGVAKHRRKFGGGKDQAIAKAVGLNKGAVPSVLDATAGLGRDAFVLASLGCHVQMIERHPIVAALLENGLERAINDEEIGYWIKERMTLLYSGSQQALLELGTDQKPDVVYLDPMFPHKKKSALVKKEMQIFQSLVGADEDADNLFEVAFSIATKRVVVKRPYHAPFLASQVPSSQILTKKNRFDLYIKRAMR